MVVHEADHIQAPVLRRDVHGAHDVGMDQIQGAFGDFSRAGVGEPPNLPHHAPLTQLGGLLDFPRIQVEPAQHSLAAHRLQARCRRVSETSVPGRIVLLDGELLEGGAHRLRLLPRNCRAVQERRLPAPTRRRRLLPASPDDADNVLVENDGTPLVRHRLDGQEVPEKGGNVEDLLYEDLLLLSVRLSAAEKDAPASLGGNRTSVSDVDLDGSRKLGVEAEEGGVVDHVRGGAGIQHPALPAPLQTRPAQSGESLVTAVRAVLRTRVLLELSLGRALLREVPRPSAVVALHFGLTGGGGLSSLGGGRSLPASSLAAASATGLLILPGDIRRDRRAEGGLLPHAPGRVDLGDSAEISPSQLSLLHVLESVLEGFARQIRLLGQDLEEDPHVLIRVLLDPDQHEPEDHVPQPQVHVRGLGLEVLEEREVLAHRHPRGELRVRELLDHQDPRHGRLPLEDGLQGDPLLPRGRLADEDVVVFGVHRPRQNVLHQRRLLQGPLPPLNGGLVLIVGSLCCSHCWSHWLVGDRLRPVDDLLETVHLEVEVGLEFPGQPVGLAVKGLEGGGHHHSLLHLRNVRNQFSPLVAPKIAAIAENRRRPWKSPNRPILPFEVESVNVLKSWGLDF